MSPKSALSPHEVFYHSTMLSDSVRLKNYHDAILEVIQNDASVVEIGTGTGILSSIIGEQTNNKISSIEYYKESADVANFLLQDCGFEHIKVINKSSYSTQVDHNPTVLVTETIGAIGLEENIVELCYDFMQRHPSIKTIIPARLKLFAIEIFSVKAEVKYTHFLKSFTNVKISKLDFKKIEVGLEQKYCESFHADELDAEKTIFGKKTLLADYRLGVSKISSFKKNLVLDTSFHCNAVHLFFEAELSPSITLSSCIDKPATHWRHSYIKRPKNGKQVTLSYSFKTNKFIAQWN